MGLDSSRKCRTCGNWFSYLFAGCPYCDGTLPPPEVSEKRRRDAFDRYNARTAHSYPLPEVGK